MKAFCWVPSLLLNRMVPSWVLKRFYLETIHLSWALCFFGSIPRDLVKQLSKEAVVCSSEILTVITCWLSFQTSFESRTKPTHGHSDPSCYLSPPLPQILFLPSSSIRGQPGTQSMNPLHCLHDNFILLETKLRSVWLAMCTDKIIRHIVFIRFWSRILLTWMWKGDNCYKKYRKPKFLN